jgi:hypothetical protein
MPLPIDANSLTRLCWLEEFFSYVTPKVTTNFMQCVMLAARYLTTPNIKAQVDGLGELQPHGTVTTTFVFALHPHLRFLSH